MEHQPEGGATGSEDLSSSMVLDLATATQIANSFNSPFFQVSHDSWMVGVSPLIALKLTILCMFLYDRQLDCLISSSKS